MKTKYVRLKSKYIDHIYNFFKGRMVYRVGPPTEVMTSKKIEFQCFEYRISIEHDEKPPQPKFGGNRFMGPEIWQHEYLISPIKINVNWPANSYEPGQFTLFQWS